MFSSFGQILGWVFQEGTSHLIVIGSTEHRRCVFLVIQEGSEVSICSQGSEQVPFITNVTVPWPGRTSEASTTNTLTDSNLQHPCKAQYLVPHIVKEM